MKAIIIDDDYPIIDGLILMIKSLNLDVHIIGTATSTNSGIELIDNSLFDILFLDIEIGEKEEGFKLLDKIVNKNFHLVFITAFNQYAVKAFRYSAIDFLLKPINPNHLHDCISKIEAKHNFKSYEESIKHFTELYTSAKSPKTMVVRTIESVHVIKIRELIRCEAQGNYTLFCFLNGTTLLTSQTLKKYDELLTIHRFLRVHQSHLINLEHVVRYDKYDGGVLIMTNDQILPVSPSRKSTLFRLLDLS